MKAFLLDFLLTAVIVVSICFFFNVPVVPALAEVVGFYLIVGVVVIIIFAYMGYALTKAMNPKIKNKKDEL